MALPAGIDRSAFRIVQEGLTNALKHARARHARVVVAYTPTRVEIEIADDGVGPTEGNGRGHGLIGIQERVKIYNGTLTTDAGANGGFVLRARLPLEGATR